MRKVLFIVFLLLIGCSNIEDNTITINDISIDVEIADTPLKITQGLMHRESLGEKEGMLFIFRSEDYRSFWMKNTLIPLDIIFVAGNGTIVDIKENFQPCEGDPCESYRSKARAKYVVEMNGGFSGENYVNVGGKVVI